MVAVRLCIRKHNWVIRKRVQANQKWALGAAGCHSVGGADSQTEPEIMMEPASSHVFAEPREEEEGLVAAGVVVDVENVSDSESDHDDAAQAAADDHLDVS